MLKLKIPKILERKPLSIGNTYHNKYSASLLYQNIYTPT